MNGCNAKQINTIRATRAAKQQCLEQRVEGLKRRADRVHKRISLSGCAAGGGIDPPVCAGEINLRPVGSIIDHRGDLRIFVRQRRRHIVLGDAEAHRQEDHRNHAVGAESAVQRGDELADHLVGIDAVQECGHIAARYITQNVLQQRAQLSDYLIGLILIQAIGAPIKNTGQVLVLTPVDIRILRILNNLKELTDDSIRILGKEVGKHVVDSRALLHAGHIDKQILICLDGIHQIAQQESTDFGCISSNGHADSNNRTLLLIRIRNILILRSQAGERIPVNGLISKAHLLCGDLYATDFGSRSRRNSTQQRAEQILDQSVQIGQIKHAVHVQTAADNSADNTGVRDGIDQLIESLLKYIVVCHVSDQREKICQFRDWIFQNCLHAVQDRIQDMSNYGNCRLIATC